jgi:hypothetical protein
MRYLLTLFGVLVLGIAFPFSSAGQADTSNTNAEQLLRGKGFALSFVPQTFVKSGFRVDVTYFFKNAEHSLTLTPTLYQGEPSRDRTGNEELSGAGTELIHNIYFGKESQEQPSSTKRAVYLAHGPFFRRFSVDYQNSNTDYTRDINKYRYSLMFGVTLVTDFSLYVDFYLGGGIRRTSVSTNDPELPEDEELFNQSFIDYGFDGVLPVSGLKIGVKF